MERQEYTFKSGVSIIKIEAPSKEEAIASFEQEFPKRNYQLKN